MPDNGMGYTCFDLLERYNIKTSIVMIFLFYYFFSLFFPSFAFRSRVYISFITIVSHLLQMDLSILSYYCYYYYLASFLFFAYVILSLLFWRNELSYIMSRKRWTILQVEERRLINYNASHAGFGHTNRQYLGDMYIKSVNWGWFLVSNINYVWDFGSLS